MRQRCPNCKCEFEGDRIVSKARQVPGPSPEAQAVLTLFREITGIEFRPLPSFVARQAARFAAYFTLEDLDLVVAWIKWAMADKNGVGFNAASLTWKKLLGDGLEFPTFQERLCLAREALKRRAWRHARRFNGNEPIATSVRVHHAMESTETTIDEATAARLRAQALQGLKDFKL